MQLKLLLTEFQLKRILFVKKKINNIQIHNYINYNVDTINGKLSQFKENSRSYSRILSQLKCRKRECCYVRDLTQK